MAACFLQVSVKAKYKHRDILTPPWNIMTTLMTNWWETMGAGIMSQLGTSQGGRAEEGGELLKRWVAEAMARDAVGRRESPSKRWVPTHVRRMLTKPWHNNVSIMASTVLTNPEPAFREHVRTHCIQRYMFAWPGNYHEIKTKHKTKQYCDTRITARRPLQRFGVGRKELLSACIVKKRLLQGSSDGGAKHICPIASSSTHKRQTTAKQIREGGLKQAWIAAHLRHVVHIILRAVKNKFFAICLENYSHKRRALWGRRSRNPTQNMF